MSVEKLPEQSHGKKNDNLDVIVPKYGKAGGFVPQNDYSQLNAQLVQNSSMSPHNQRGSLLQPLSHKVKKQ